MNTLERVKTFVEVLGRSPALGVRNIERLHRELAIHPTPCTVVHAERSFSLLHFAPPPGSPARTPLLLVPSLINHWYVLDLLVGHSLVAALTATGQPVYVMAWARPHDGQGELGLDHVVLSLIDRAVQRTARHAGTSRVALLGQCLGGTLALAYAALEPARVDRLITLTTPVDFSQGGQLATWTSAEAMDIGTIARAHPGVVPDRLVYGAFPLLDPRALITRHRVLFENLQYEEFRRVYEAIDLWTTEHLPVARGVLVGLVRDLYQDNVLWRDRWELAGRPVRLAEVRCPLLNVVAAQDDIVPQGATRPLLDRIGSTVKEEFLSPLGHVTLIIAHPLRFQTYQAIATFCGRQWTEQPAG